MENPVGWDEKKQKNKQSWQGLKRKGVKRSVKNKPETLDKIVKDQIRLLNCTVMRSGGNEKCWGMDHRIYVTATMAHCSSLRMCVEMEVFFFREGWLGHIASLDQPAPSLSLHKHTHIHWHGVDKQINEWALTTAQGRKAMRNWLERSKWGHSVEASR